MILSSFDLFPCLVIDLFLLTAHFEPDLDKNVIIGFLISWFRFSCHIRKDNSSSSNCFYLELSCVFEFGLSSSADEEVRIELICCYYS